MGLVPLITPTSVTYNAAGNGGAGQWEVAFPTSGFSGFFAHSGSTAPLPVQFLNIAAKANGAVNSIEWQIGAEPDGTQFAVERETAGNFQSIGAVPGNKAASYLFHDEKPLAGTNRYRIRATDASGEASYSKIVSVNRATGNFQIVAFPNPTDNGLITLRTQGAAGKVAQVSVWNAVGQLVQQVPMSQEALNLDLSSLAAGIYTVRYTDDARTETVQVTRR